MWVETTAEVYRAIYSQHGKDFGVHGSFTDMDGTHPVGFGKPTILTEWGFRGADEPLIKSIGTKENEEDKDFEYQYFINKVKN